MQMERVAIFGLGNVALDCARVLLRGEDAMGRTDIARHAQEALRQSTVKRVDVIGRRGPVQVELVYMLCLVCYYIYAERLHRLKSTCPAEQSKGCSISTRQSIQRPQRELPHEGLAVAGGTCLSVMQAAFTTKELREIIKLPGVQVHVSPEAMQLTEADRAEMQASRLKKRVFDILKAASEAPASG